MSISTALHNAYSGLTAASRSAESVTNNLANALTEGYARRETSLSSVVADGLGQGVRVTGVERATDRVATESRRSAGTNSAVADLRLEAAERMSRAMGDPTSGAALSDRVTAFERAIATAANEPSSQTGLDLTVLRAGELADQLNRASGELSAIRADVEVQIEGEVETLNTTLSDLKDINIEIRRRVNSSGDINGLLDKREQLIDRVSEIVPVIVVERPFEQVALFTPEGGTLVDGHSSVAQFSFSATPFIDHSMTIGAPLSGLVVNGNTVPIGNGTGFFDGGSLGALFDVRDTEVPTLNGQLDGLARDLIERLQDPAVDTSLAVGDAGFFTDGGAAFAVANEVGLAGRISVNALADPDQGGASWRVRDGLNAAAPGFAGQNTILRNMETAMSVQRAPGAGLGMTSSNSAGGFFGSVTAGAAQAHGWHQEAADFALTEYSVMREVESGRTGVDSDEQLQRLMDVERWYQANARVAQTLDDMMGELLRMVG